MDQRNEVSGGAVPGLELGQQEFTKYIPDYLGRLALWLPPEQLDECLADLGVTLSASSSRIVTPVLDTVGVIYEEYDIYHQRFPEEPEEACLRRRDRLLGMLMRGLAGIDGETRQEAMLVLGQRVFGSAQLSNGEKSRAFPPDGPKTADYLPSGGRGCTVLLLSGLHAGAAVPIFDDPAAAGRLYL